MSKYAVGLDFGTLSVRALVADVSSGEELGTAVYEYPHGVITGKLPCGTPIPDGWALQHPQDYIDGIAEVVPKAVAESGVDVKDIIGIGVDFTANTFLPVDENNYPLCLKKEYEDRPHAWVKLWKHHGKSEYAEKMRAVAVERNEPFLKYYDNTVSAEWMFPRLLEILEEDPGIYDSAAGFIEAGDWVVKLLTGSDKRSITLASVKALWTKEYGFPSEDYFAAVNPKFRKVAVEKMGKEFYPLGENAGNLTEYGAKLTGLDTDTAVSVGCADGHIVMMLVGDLESGSMIASVGTSGVQLMVADRFIEVPGLCGICEDAVVPGMYSYEAGQRCVGDSLNWLVDNAVPKSCFDAADRAGVNIHQYLSDLAAKQRPGESGLIALDWWNGNRSVLCNFDLSGLVLGLTLETKPEDIYRAFIEATAFGLRKIIDSFEDNGLKINHLYTCGGITKKNRLFMQIYSDVLNREIRIISTSQGTALSGAMLGAIAAGKERGGYGSMKEAAAAMGGSYEKVYSPNAENAAIYEELYGEYCLLHDYFGKGVNDVMARMRRIRSRFDAQQCE